MEIRTGVCWWNTKLAPIKGSANTKVHLEFVAKIIELLAEREQIDLFCLGEVNAATMSELAELTSDRRYIYEERTNRDAGVKFGMGIIYNRERLVVGPSRYRSRSIGQNVRKIHQYFPIEYVDGTRIHVFLVHWPSRLHADSVIRGQIATDLRASINGINGSGVEKIIVLGDFNDEPYNDSVSEFLFATRDLEMAQRNPRLLYNPFWKLLTNNEKYSKSNSTTKPIGSYFYKGDKIHRWRVFDQVMFSSSLLGSTKWHLDEERTGIISLPDVLNIGPGGNDHIDHLPVVAALEWEIDLG